jgi:hypothetical protein
MSLTKGGWVGVPTLRSHWRTRGVSSSAMEKKRRPVVAGIGSQWRAPFEFAACMCLSTLWRGTGAIGGRDIEKAWMLVLLQWPRIEAMRCSGAMYESRPEYRWLKIKIGWSRLYREAEMGRRCGTSPKENVMAEWSLEDGEAVMKWDGGAE